MGICYTAPCTHRTLRRKLKGDRICLMRSRAEGESIDCLLVLVEALDLQHSIRHSIQRAACDVHHRRLLHAVVQCLRQEACNAARWPIGGPQGTLAVTSLLVRVSNTRTCRSPPAARNFPSCRHMSVPAHTI
jgi:hypothetical protein